MLKIHLEPKNAYKIGHEKSRVFNAVGTIPFMPSKPGQVFKVGMPNPNAVKSSIERAK